MMLTEAEKTKYVEEFKPIIYNRARLYCWNMSNFEDFMQEGYIGLLVSLDRFDPNKGLKHPYAYVIHWINARMQQLRKKLAVKETSYIDEIDYGIDNIPLSQVVEQHGIEEKLLNQVSGLEKRRKRIIEYKWLEGNGYGSLTPLAKELGVSVERVRQLELSAFENLKEEIGE